MKLVGLILLASLSARAALVGNATVMNDTNSLHVSLPSNFWGAAGGTNGFPFDPAFSNAVNTVSLVSFKTNSVIYVGPGPSGAGTGTLTGTGQLWNPYVGDLDLLVSNMPISTTAILLPGTFWTGPGLVLNTGQRLVGFGQQITTVKRDNTKAFQTGVAVISSPPTSQNVYVGHMTVDCNTTNGTSIAVNAVNLDGSFNLQEDIFAINASGSNANNHETFVLACGGNTTNYSTHNSIINCHVAQVNGDYGAGIFIFGEQGLVDNCLVELPPMINTQPPFLYCYGVSKSCNSTFANSTGTGGQLGFYTDSFGETNLTLFNMRFLDQRVGIDFAKASAGTVIYGLNLLNCTVALSPFAFLSGAGITLTASNGLFNALLSQNLVHYDNDISFQTNYQVPALIIETNVAVNLKVIYNTWGTNGFATNMPISTGTTNLIYTGNTTVSGTLLPNMP